MRCAAGCVLDVWIADAEVGWVGLQLKDLEFLIFDDLGKGPACWWRFNTRSPSVLRVTGYFLLRRCV